MKWVLVTGACGGLGKAVAERLLSDGYGVWAVHRDEDALNEAFAGYENARIHACDLSSEPDTVQMMDHIYKQTGPLSGLVHCAGNNRIVQLHMIKQKHIDELFKVHVYAALLMCSLFSKKGRFAEGASIVLFSSMAAHEGASGNSVYAAAKSAVEGFVRSSASDFAEKGIRINAVVPGDVDAGMFRRFLSHLNEEQAAARRKQYPLGFGNSGDIADLVEFLLSERSSWITGQCHVADGGHSVRNA